jgi:hypothetical protein
MKDANRALGDEIERVLIVLERNLAPADALALVGLSGAVRMRQRNRRGAYKIEREKIQRHF